MARGRTGGDESGFVGEVGESVEASFSAEDVGEHAQVHLGVGGFAVLGVAVFDDEDLAVGPRCVGAVSEHAARVVIVLVVDHPGEDVAARAGW